MDSREERIDRIQTALQKAKVETLQAIEDILAKSRVIKRTRSDADNIVPEATPGSSQQSAQRAAQRRKKELDDQVFHIDPETNGALFCLREWTNLENGRDYHPRLFLLTMIVRSIFATVSGLRDACAAQRGKVWRLELDGSRVERSCLFRKVACTFGHVTTQASSRGLRPPS